MESIRGKTAVVIGGSGRVGGATVKALLADGARVTALARSAGGLENLRTAMGRAEAAALQIVPADAADPSTAARVLRELRPDLVVLALGVRPHSVPLDEQTWETFSATWNADVQAAFHFVKAALTLPLSPGSTVVVVSSGAAINGSPLSGGYAGAKRMQWLLARYAQGFSDKKKLGLRFVAVLPNQMIAGTEIAEMASNAYGQWLGITSEAFMARFKAPLDAQAVAASIMSVLRRDDGVLGDEVTAIAVSGMGAEPLA